MKNTCITTFHRIASLAAMRLVRNDRYTRARAPVGACTERSKVTGARIPEKNVIANRGFQPEADPPVAEAGEAIS